MSEQQLTQVTMALTEAELAKLKAVSLQHGDAELGATLRRLVLEAAGPDAPAAPAQPETPTGAA